MTSPDDLAARVLAAIEETERLAREVASSVGPGWIGTLDGVESDRDGEMYHVVVPLWSPLAQYIAARDPASALRRCAADRKLIADVQGWPHLTVGDTWYSCAQAIDDWEKDAAPGSACADEDRAGQPCDCGLVDRQRTVLMALAVGYGVLEPTEAS